MFTKEEIMARMKKGESLDTIANEMAEVLNDVKKDYRDNSDYFKNYAIIVLKKKRRKNKKRRRGLLGLKKKRS